MSLLKKLKNKDLLQVGLFINGEWINKNRQTFNVFNPSNGYKIATVCKVTSEDLESSSKSALIAFSKWKSISTYDRSNILFKWLQLIDKNKKDLATILVTEQGKPYNEAIKEIEYGANYLAWYLEEAKRIYGDTIIARDIDNRITVVNEPIGVCALISPWNFPFAMLMRKIAPALSVGCSVICKPSKLTPLTCNALVYLASQSGIPKGVINVVNGDSEKIADFFCNNISIKKISFTGSTDVGISIYRKSANTMKKLSLELGGNAPLIVCDDADIINAVNGIIKSKFRASGQTCVCSNRILVDKKIKSELLKQLVKEVKKLKLGDGFKKGIDIGPLINKEAIIHANELIENASKNGAKILLGGTIDKKVGGLFFKPTVIDCKTINIKMFSEEIFAPIIAIYSFSTIEEAISIANNTNYGLASYLFTKDIRNYYKISEELQFGIIGVNTGIISDANIPFGGIKLSGFGKEGGYEGLDEYLIKKYICIKII